METQCIQEQMEFQQLGRREVIGRFDGGMISSDAGGIAVARGGEVFWYSQAVCGSVFETTAIRSGSSTVCETLISQRVYGIALGYEDLNDHDSLRHDVVMGVLCEKSDPSGMERARKRDQGKGDSGQEHAQSIRANARGCQ